MIKTQGIVVSMVRMLPLLLVTVYHVVPPSVVVVSHFLILSRKPIGTALGSSCLKSGTVQRV